MGSEFCIIEFTTCSLNFEMNRLLTILKKTKLNFGQTAVFIHGGMGGINYFALKPRDFIRFSKEDIKSNSSRGLVNSITNTKRAVDCQIDSILDNYGIQFDKIPKYSEELVKRVEIYNSKLPYKLKLIQALKFAPSGLINKIRNLRNKLEHYYEIPEKQYVREAIEIAELFILSCENKTNSFDDITISSMNFYKNAILTNDSFENYLEFDFNHNKKKFSITPYINMQPIRKLHFDQNNEEFYFILRLVNSLEDMPSFIDSLILLLEYVNHPIPSKNVSGEWV